MCLQSYCYSSSTTIIIIVATIVRFQLAGTKLVSSSLRSVCEGGSQCLCLSTQLEIESLSLYLQHFPVLFVFLGCRGTSPVQLTWEEDAY